MIQEWLMRAGPYRMYVTMLLVLSVACSGSAVDPGVEDVSGTYVLDRVDGASLPVRITGEGGCEPTITDGRLDLDPAFSDRRPLYGWRAHGAPCASDPRPLADASVIARDAGEWTLRGDEVRFASVQGRGRYAAALARGPGGAAFMVELGGRSYAFRQVSRSGDPTSAVVVIVVDEVGRPVDGVPLLFGAPGGLVLRGASNVAVPFGTSGPPGTWTVTVTPPAGYVVAPGHPNPVTVTVAGGAQAEVRIVLSTVPPS
jgi:hypothetical protein